MLRLFSLLQLLLNVLIVSAQDDALHFTSGITSPAPVPGQPFTITWAGGDENTTVYIVLNYLFPDTPNQDIPYIMTDILSNAPNNGSWTYNVPLNINAGRYEFSIGINPLLQSDSTGVFTILSSQTSYVSPTATSSAAAQQTYNGCGLPPLPDFTYTAYQPPCTVTTNGRVETIYPIVPASDSSLFFGGSQTATMAQVASTTSTTTMSTSVNTAFATGVFAQALQCATVVTPKTTSFVASGTTTVLSTVGCAQTTGVASALNGVCHTSGYTTFSVSGVTSACCPSGWATTSLNTALFCFTATGSNNKRDVAARQASTQTSVSSGQTTVTLGGLAFTPAGIETKAELFTSSSTGTAGSGPSTTTSGTAASASPSKSRAERVESIESRMTLAICAMLALYGAC